MSPARSAAEAPPVPRPHAAPSAPSPASAHGVTPQSTPKDVSPRADQEQRTAAATSGTAQQAGQQWKIQPLPGEPPLTLYRDKRMVVLPPGTEVDRYGEANGNVTYAARTQYQHRSLPTDWSSFPYHVYRLQRPLEALTGLAVPWFEQPGGGTAFVLPRSISELMADGSLVEIEEAAAPRS